jgi:hypothetical protein
MTGDTDSDARYKLVPTPDDKKVFHDIIDGSWDDIRTKYPELFFQNGKLIGGRAPNSVRAFKLFIDKIDNYVRYGVASEEEEIPI